MIDDGTVKRIFLVEDDKALSRLICRHLAAAGFFIDCASAGKTALERLTAESFDLLLLDYSLPDMTSDRIVQSIQERGTEIPFIVITGQGDEEVAVRMMKLGARDYLIKDATLLEHISIAVNNVCRQIVTERALAKAQQEISDYRSSLDMALDSSGTGTWTFNVKTKKVFQDDHFLHLLGYRNGEPAPVYTEEACHPDDRPRIAGEMEKFLAGASETYSVDCRLRHKSGDWIWLHARGKIAERDKDGSPLLVAGIAHDVSGLKLAEISLKKSEENFKALAMNANDGVTVINERGERLYSNWKIARFCGYTPEEWEAMPRKEKVHPDDWRLLQANNWRYIPSLDYPGLYELRYLRKDGSVLYTEIAADATTWDNKPAKIFIIRDVTERKTAEDALLKSEKNFRQLSENANDAICIADKNGGEIKYCNRKMEEMLGYGRGELLGKKRLDIIHPDFHRQYDEQRITRKGGGSLPQIYETAYLTTDGRIVPVEVSNAHTEWLGYKAHIFFSRDITKRKNAEAALLQSEANYHALAEDASDGITIYIRRKCVYCNRKMQLLLRRSEADILGMKRTDYVHPDDRHLPMEYHNSRKAGATTLDNYEIRYVTGDGETVPVEVSVAYTVWQGQKAHIFFTRDITSRKEAERELRLSEENFHALADNANDGIAIYIDKARNCVYCNRRMQQMLERSESEILKMQRLDYIHPEDRHLPKVHHRLKMSGYVTFDTYEIRYLKADGKTLPIEVSTARTYWQGKRAHIFFNRDITQRKEADRELRATQELQQKVFESQKDAIFVLNNEMPPRVIKCNPAACDIFGYSAEEINGLGTNLLHVDEKSRREYQKRTRRALKEYGYLEDMEFQMRRKDGTVFPSSHSELPLTGNEGKRIGWVSVVRDITKYKTAEDNLKRERDNAQLYLDVAGVIILVLDTEGRVKLINKKGCEILGVPEKAVIGKDWVANFIPEEFRKDIGQIHRQPGEGDGKIVEYWVNPVLTKSGKERLIAWHNIRLFDSDGNLTGILSSGEDMTQQQKAMKREHEIEILRRTDKMRTQLLANISHELRTPLTSIMGSVYTLLREDVYWDEEERKEFLRILDKEANRLNRLITDLLDMSRLDAGAGKLSLDYYQINDFLNLAAKPLQQAFRKHKITVSEEAEPVLVHADQSAIYQVINNLVENAAKYSPEGSEINLSYKTNRNKVVVCVSDQGEGIPGDVLPRIFDRFYHTEKIVAGRKQGTGLGLAICRGIIKAHRGKIWAESESGSGSRFYFTLTAKRE